MMARQPLYGTLSSGMMAGLGATSMVLLLIMLRTLIGPFQFSVGTVDFATTEASIVIWQPASLKQAPLEDHEAGRWAWDALLDSGKKRAVDSLADVPAQATVVVSDARWLTDAEAEAVEKFIRSGGRVLMSGWIGVRSGENWDAGIERMKRLLRVASVERLDAERSYFVAAGARGPLSAPLRPSERIGLAKEPVVPAIPNADANLYWSSWTLSPVAEQSGAARRLELGRGRLVWLASTAGSVAWNPTGADQMRRLIFAAIDWMNQVPVAELRAWPQGLPFGALVAMDTEAEFPNSLTVAKGVETGGYPFTFFIVNSDLAPYASALSRLSSVGEISSHADVHDGFKDVPYAEQFARLSQSRQDLLERGAEGVRGFRPPYESYDDQTKRALVEAGYDYMVGDLKLEAMVPRIVQPAGPDRDLVQVPRAAYDDFDFYENLKLSRVSQVEPLMLKDLAHAQHVGGLYYFSLHTQYFGQQERVDMLGRVAEELDKRGAWIANAGELADWWRVRAACSLHTKRVGPNRVRIEVSNHGKREARDLVVRLHLNASVSSLDVAGTKLFQSSPKVVLSADGHYADIHLPKIARGATREYFADLGPITLPASATGEIAEP